MYLSDGYVFFQLLKLFWIIVVNQHLTKFRSFNKVRVIFNV